MTATSLLEKRQMDGVLADSIGARARLLLTYGSAFGWQAIKSTFLSRCDSSRTILLTIRQPDLPRTATIPEPGARLGVTFRVGRRKCMFATELASLSWDGPDGVATVRWPDRVHQLHRRAYERVSPPDGACIPVRLTQVEAGSGSSCIRNNGLGIRNVCHGQLVDVSAGGLRVTVQDTRNFTPGGTCRCAFTPRTGKAPLVIDGLVRHRGTADDGRPAIGFQFVGLETAPEGCRTLDRLARIVGHLQRARSRMKVRQRRSSS